MIVTGYKSEKFYVTISKSTQMDLCVRAIKKAGSEKKLSDLIGVPAGTFYFYKKALFHLPQSRFLSIINYLGLNEADFNYKLVDGNESRRKGGRIAYHKSKKSGAFGVLHEKMRKASSEYMRKWHKTMRESKKQEYHELQYSRFKKISKYSLKTNKGHLVRNWLEKEVADILLENKISYEYEPYILANKRVYFPDFVCNKTIIECTYWKGSIKAESLKSKIKDFETAGFIVWVVIPRALESFYKPIENNIIYLEELGGQKMVGD